MLFHSQFRFFFLVSLICIFRGLQHLIFSRPIMYTIRGAGMQDREREKERGKLSSLSLSPCLRACRDAHRGCAPPVRTRERPEARIDMGRRVPKYTLTHNERPGVPCECFNSHRHPTPHPPPPSLSLLPKSYYVVRGVKERYCVCVCVRYVCQPWDSSLPPALVSNFNWRVFEGE